MHRQRRPVVQLLLALVVILPAVFYLAISFVSLISKVLGKDMSSLVTPKLVTTIAVALSIGVGVLFRYKASAGPLLHTPLRSRRPCRCCFSVYCLWLCRGRGH